MEKESERRRQVECGIKLDAVVPNLTCYLLCGQITRRLLECDITSSCELDFKVLREWVTCICIVTFDLEAGQVRGRKKKEGQRGVGKFFPASCCPALLSLPLRQLRSATHPRLSCRRATTRASATCHFPTATRGAWETTSTRFASGLRHVPRWPVRPHPPRPR